MYSGTSYAGNPYAVGSGSGYRAAPSSSSSSASSTSSSNTGNGTSSVLANPYLALGLGASLAPVAADGVPRSASASSTGSDGGSSVASGSSTGGSSYLMGASYGATASMSAPLAPLTAPSTIAPLAVSTPLSVSSSPASPGGSSTSSNGSTSSLGAFFASPLLSGALNGSGGNTASIGAASPYCASAPPYASAQAGSGAAGAASAAPVGAAGGAGGSSNSGGMTDAPAASSGAAACGCCKARGPGRRKAAAGGGRAAGCCGGHCSSRSQIRIEVAETDLGPGEEEPTYHLKLDLNGRVYVAARTHAQLRMLVETLRVKGYVLPRPFPEVRDVMAQAPVKVMAADDRLVQALPFYEGFGYSIKALASTVLRSSAAAGLRSRRRSFLVEQVTQRVEGFLKALFLENDDLQYEQEVYHFFWEPLEKKLQPVLEEGSDSEDEGVAGGCGSQSGETEGSSSEDDEELAARCAAALAVRA